MTRHARTRSIACAVALAAVVAVGTVGCGGGSDDATPSAASSTTTAAATKLTAAMAKLKADAAEFGAPSVSGSVLSFGSTKINDDFTIVDAVTAEFGCTATFFVAQGPAFVRVSTSVMKEGKRAVGTELDPAGPVIIQIRQGKSFSGVVDILGDEYDTIYEPIVDAKGTVLGVYYVGVKVPG
jgi:hypothetical protein